MTLQRVSKRTLALFCVSMLAVLAGGFLLLVPHLSGRAFAASRQVPTTCNMQPDFAHCNNLDPVQQLCAAPDTTTISMDITDTQGKVVGRVDRRYSQVCHSWWGRVLDYRHIQGAAINIQVGTNGYTLPFNAVAYSDMVFAAPNVPAPAITGTLMTNGKPDASLSATIPAVSIPVTQ